MIRPRSEAVDSEGVDSGRGARPSRRATARRVEEVEQVEEETEGGRARPKHRGRDRERDRGRRGRAAEEPAASRRESAESEATPAQTMRPRQADRRPGRRTTDPSPQIDVRRDLELVVIVAFAIGLALVIQAFVVKPYQIPSGSMIPTLEVGQRVLVQRVSYHFSDPEIGDIVVFHPPEGADTTEKCGVRRAAATRPARSRSTEPADTNFIKRVVATPGDTLKIEDGHAIVNGESIPDDFITALRRRPRVQPPEGDHDPARPLLHDGRQPWSQRRQPLLGTRPTGLDHRQGLCHLLAPRPNRPPLGRGSAAARPDAPRRTAWLFRFDQQFGHRFVAGADEAGRGSLAGPLVAAAVLLDYRRLGPTSAGHSPDSTTPSARPRRSGSASTRRCSPQPPGGGDGPLRRRDRLSRASRDQSAAPWPTCSDRSRCPAPSASATASGSAPAAGSITRRDRGRRPQRRDRRRLGDRQGDPGPLHEAGRRVLPGLGLRQERRLLVTAPPRGDRPDRDLLAASPLFASTAYSQLELDSA